MGSSIWFKVVSKVDETRNIVVSRIKINSVSKTRVERKFIVTIPRNCGNAVQRNKVKRILKNKFQENIQAFPEGKGLWLRLKRKTSMIKSHENLKNIVQEIEKGISKVI